MNTLIVKYFPSGQNSNTKKLLSHFEPLIKGDVTEIDLLITPPPIFDQKSLSMYVKRDYMGQKLDDREAEILKPFDNLISLVKKSNILVIATPMHNASMPGIVKSFMDAIMLKNHAFTDNNTGLLGEKALVIFTSGGDLRPESSFYHFNHFDPLIKSNLGLIGYKDIRIVNAGTSNPDKLEENMQYAKSRLEEIAAEWY